MTNLEALLAECEPFTISNRVAQKALADAGLLAEEGYSNKASVAKASVFALSRFLALRSEGEGAFSQSFDLEGLKSRIRRLCELSGLDASSFIVQTTIKDGSKFW